MHKLKGHPMKLLIPILLLLSASAGSALTLTNPTMTTDVHKTLSARTLRHVQGSTAHQPWRFVDGDAAYDLTGATTVYLKYGPSDNEWGQTVTGSLVNVTNGLVSVPFTVANTSTNGTFPFNLRVSDGTTVLCRAYGDLVLIPEAGASSTTFPFGTNVDLIGYTFINEPWLEADDLPTLYTDAYARALGGTNSAAITNEAALRAAGDVAGSNYADLVVGEHNTNVAAHADIRASVTNLQANTTNWNTAYSHTTESSNTVHGGFIRIAYDNATNGMAQIVAHLVEPWQTVHGGYLKTAYDTGTNALAIAQAAFGWGDHALAGYLTNETQTLQQVLDQGNTATNALAVSNSIMALSVRDIGLNNAYMDLGGQYRTRLWGEMWVISDVYSWGSTAAGGNNIGSTANRWGGFYGTQGNFLTNLTLAGQSATSIVDTITGSNLELPTGQAVTSYIASATAKGATRVEWANGYATLSGTVWTVSTWTNTTAVYVSATNGAGYNGPALGTVWTNPTYDGVIWTYAGGLLTADDDAVSDLYAPASWQYLSGGYYLSVGPITIPGDLIADNGPYFGTMTLSWVPSTNTVSWDMGSFLTAESDPVFTNWASTNTYIVTSTNLAAQDAAGKYVPTSRTITVNGQAGTLDANTSLALTEAGSAITNWIGWLGTAAAYGALTTTNANTIYYTW